MQLPPQLLASIADSECELVQWDGLQRTATVRITKDALPEVGLLHFAGVSFVHFPNYLTVDTIAAYAQATLPNMDVFPDLAEQIDMDEAAIVFYDVWQQQHSYIIARSCHYQTVAQPVAEHTVVDLGQELRLSVEPLNLIDMWKVLNVLVVSFDRMGHYWLSQGEDAAKEALHQFIKPALVRDIAHAHSILDGVLDEQAPALSAYLEATPDDELGLHYWDGPAPNQE